MTHGLGCQGDCATCLRTRRVVRTVGAELLDVIGSAIEHPDWQQRDREPLADVERRRAALLADVERERYFGQQRALLADVERERFGGRA